MSKGRLRRVFAWFGLVVASVAIGASLFAYTYVTDSRTLVALMRSQAPRFFPDSVLRVEHAQIRPLLGLIEITRANLSQSIGGAPLATLSVPWIQIRCDTREFWRGRFEPREVIIAQPVLRLKQRDDGSWNIEGLLADPWPDDIEMQPTIRVTKGSVELVDDAGRAMILHDVELTLESVGGTAFQFEGTAQGDALRHVSLAGVVDVVAGRASIHRCELTGVTLSEELRERLPALYREAWIDWGIAGGELDVTLVNFNFEPGGRISGDQRVQFALRSGAWTCPRLPFPLRDIMASARIEGGKLVVSRAEGRYGKTDVVVHSAMFDLTESDPLAGAFAVELTIRELELDARLREQLPDDLGVIWDTFALEGTDDLGRISVSARVARAGPEEETQVSATIDLLDVAMCFQGFPMPLERLRGRMTLRNDRLTVEHIETLVGPRPLVIKGTIDQLATDPVVELELSAGSLPIDEQGVFVKALPPSVAELVTQFHPTGTVGCVARVKRVPAATPASGEPWGEVSVFAAIEFNEGCSMRWDGLPYPVRRLSGRLKLTPTGCDFTELQGENGIARISASGRVDALDGERFAADIRLIAENLPFDQQLRDALPPEWQGTWRILRPNGTSTLDAHVVAGWPERPDRTHLTIKVEPEDYAEVKLVITPAPGTPGIVDGQRIELPPMRGVSGVFEFDNGLVTMSDVAFRFREAPVKFRSGSMTLAESGKLDLRIGHLEFAKLRFDSELRRIMPPLMASFAQKLDENKPLRGQGDLAIAWSGNPTEPAVCTWDRVKILLDDVRVLAGQAPVEHIHGELSNVSGRSDGQSLSLTGRLDAESLIVAGLQVSKLRTPIEVADGKATLGEIQARLLDGDLIGQFEVTLTNVPEYRGWSQLRGADLARLSQTLPGRQGLSGKLTGQVELSGAGPDLRQVSGSGSARLSNADLGKLPWFLRLVSPLNLARDGNAAFDSGQVDFVIKDGVLDLNPIRITGNTISLHGFGTVNSQGEIDLEFTPIAGRDEKFRVPGLSDLTRAATTQMIRINASGPIGAPNVRPVPVPGASQRVSDIARKVLDRDRGDERGGSAPKH